MSLQFHPLLPATAAWPDYTTSDRSDRHYLGKRFSQGWIPNPTGWLHLFHPYLSMGRHLHSATFRPGALRTRVKTLAFPTGRSAAL
jgi:hypothetical protein